MAEQVSLKPDSATSLVCLGHQGSGRRVQGNSWVPEAARGEMRLSEREEVSGGACMMNDAQVWLGTAGWRSEGTQEEVCVCVDVCT